MNIGSINTQLDGINAIYQLQRLSYFDIKEISICDDEFINEKFKDMLFHFQDCIFKLNMKHAERTNFDGTILFEDTL